MNEETENSSLRKDIIAIDGPAGSGKSTVARRVAEELNFLYVDSGAIYRTYTLQFLRHDLNVENEDEIADVLSQSKIELKNTSAGVSIYLDRENVTKEIRSLEVTQAVSSVSKLPKVRRLVLDKLRSIAEIGSAVIEGRDIGTVVFPNAGLKIFMQASLEERANRRYAELKESGLSVDFNKIKSDIARRDQQDSERKHSPLKQAEDAFILDTTNLNIEQCVEFIKKKVEAISR